MSYSLGLPKGSHERDSKVLVTNYKSNKNRHLRALIRNSVLCDKLMRHIDCRENPSIKKMQINPAS